jgi:hypothetical protein
MKWRRDDWAFAGMLVVLVVADAYLFAWALRQGA